MATAEEARRWAEWRDAHADILALLQIPQVYLKSELYWRDFLTHGQLHFYSDLDEDKAARAYKVGSLSVDEARAFFELIKDSYPNGWSNVDFVIWTIHRILQADTWAQQYFPKCRDRAAAMARMVAERFWSGFHDLTPDTQFKEYARQTGTDTARELTDALERLTGVRIAVEDAQSLETIRDLIDYYE